MAQSRPITGYSIVLHTQSTGKLIIWLRWILPSHSILSILTLGYTIDIYDNTKYIEKISRVLHRLFGFQKDTLYKVFYTQGYDDCLGCPDHGCCSLYAIL